MLGAAERLADKYALAIFEIATDKTSVEGMYDQLIAVQSLLKDNSELESFVNNPLVPKASKKEVAQKVLNDGIDPMLLNFIMVLLEKNRMSLFDTICRSYKKFLNEKENIVEVKVTTARELSAEQEAEVSAKIAKMLNKKVVLSKHLDERIIGGIVIQVGDKLIDGSVVRQLKNIKRSLQSIDVREIGVTN